ncbi:PREDICTED: glutamate receptor ionotropic, delta-1-like [Priapulus caudatus]|uniref:Glutamate receptor ionotropic, delta-1-like n=1 Tax=Priapulus caudatus TaxID=37621 RepID=A0ABM1EH31_PRICU|nr:PREDICTED: glutamate receptor ionotropic, delta-1-like [Priapulus caudatus]
MLGGGELGEQYELQEGAPPPARASPEDGLHGAHLRAGYWRYESTPRTDHAWLTLSRSILADFSRFYNFTFDVVTIPAADDAVSLVADGRVDVLLNFLTVTPQRQRRVTFLSPLVKTHKTFLVRRPPLVSGFTFFAAFDVTTWLTLLAVTVATAATTAALDGRLAPWREHAADRGGGEGCASDRRGSALLAYYARYVFGSLLKQGGPRLPAATPARVMLATWWCFAIIVAALYGATIVSLLAIAQAKQPFTSLAQLSAGGTGVQPVVVRGQSIIELLSSSPADSDLGRLWATIDGVDGATVDSMPEGLRRSLRGDAAMTGNGVEMVLAMMEDEEEVLGHDAAGQPFCRLALSPVRFLPANMAWSLPLGSPYASVLDHAMVRSIESGLFAKWLNDIFPIWLKLCMNHPETTMQTTALSMGHLSGTFLVLVYGGVVAAAVLAAETAFHHLRKVGRRHFFQRQG